ncbi:MAG: acylphosphatase [Candidatus Pacearchaeota archaeon]
MKKSVRITVSGSIQPVFFNRFIKENADKLGVRGFVRNSDGKAEVFLEGNFDAVNEMIPICKKGPQHALIRNIDEKEEKYQGFTEFKIMNF